MEAKLKELGDRKLALLRGVLELTQRELLLVNLEELTPLLEQKDVLIVRIREVDSAIGELMPPGGEDAPPPWQDNLLSLVEAILDNERTMEARIEEEQTDLKTELQTLERQGRVKQYLERSRLPGRSVNLKR